MRCWPVAGFTAIGQWARDAGSVELGRLGLRRGPDESTLRRVFAVMDADGLDRVLGARAVTRAAVVQGRRVIAIDGKTMRGARGAARAAPHLVAALTHETGVAVGPVAVADKSNEIPAARDLLAVLDVQGAVVTMDAMHTRHEPATTVTDAGGDYVFTVKGNQKHLYARLKALPWALVAAHTSMSGAHGRRVRRTIKVICVPSWIEFTGAAQVAQLRRTTTRRGKKSVEIVDLITSADARAASPGNPRDLDPGALGDREPAALGPRRHVRRRPLPSPHRPRATRHGITPQPRDQPPAHRRTHEHRRRHPTSRSRRRPTRRPTPHSITTDVAGT